MTQQEAEVILKVNDQQARDKLQALENQAKELRAKFADAFKRGDTREINEINAKLQKTNKEINNMRTNAANIRAAMVRLNEASPRDLQRTIKLINNELNSGRVKRGTKEWDDYIAKLKQVKGELKKVKAEMDLDDKGGFFSRIKNNINDWGATAAAAMAAFAGVVMSGKQAVQAYADMEAEMANVRKYTGMTAEEVERLNEELKKIDTRTSREDLNKLAQEAGRLGKTSMEDVLGFVRAADQINVALDDLGEGATLTLSKLTGIFGDEARYGTEQSLLKVGSVINELSQNCSASAPYLAEFASRLGGVGSQAGLSVQQIMGFAAVLDSNNQNLEASATALSQIIVRIYQDPAKYARIAGLDIENFANLVKTDMNSALIELLGALNQVGGMDKLSPMFKDMGENGSRAISTLSTLASNIDAVRSQQQVANEAFSQGTSVTKEFNVQNNTVQAGLDKAKKGFNEMAVTLGEQLLPVMRYCISGTSMLMRVMSAIVGFIVKYKGALLTLTAAVGAYHIAVNIAIIKTKLHATWLGIVKVATVAWTVATKACAVVVALCSGNITKATTAFKALSVAIRMSPIGLLVSLITAVATALIVFSKKTNAATEAQKALNDITNEANKKLVEEKDKIELLVQAANNENLSLDQRKKAIEKLNQIIPDYNAHLDTTTGKYMANKEALDKYIQSLRTKYELEGAKEKLTEIGKNIADLNIEKQLTQSQLDRERQRAANAVPRTSSGTPTPQTSSGAMAPHSVHTAIDNSATIQSLENSLNNIDRKIGIENEKRDAILNIYGEDMQQEAISETTDTIGGGNSGQVNSGGTGTSTDKFVAEKEWLSSEKARIATETSLGLMTYEDYRKQLDELDKQYWEKIAARQDLTVDERFEASNRLIEIAQKEARAQEQISADQLRDRISDYTEEYDEYLLLQREAFANGEISEQEYNDRRILAEIDYLTKLRDLYADGSDERAEYDRRISEKELDRKIKANEKFNKAYSEIFNRFISNTAEDQIKIYEEVLKKLVEECKITAEQAADILAQLRAEQKASTTAGDINKNYSITPVSDAVSAQVTKLDKELADGKITADEYNEAIRHIATDAMEQALGCDNMVAQVFKMTDAWMTFFEKIGEEGFNWKEGFATAMTSTIALMQSAFSMASEFIKADLEIQTAAIEKRYDAEIERAEGNTYKIKKLEKQKEKEIAKIKNEANKKMFAMQVIQAVAQTATNALAAYGSAAAIPVVGYILAPIAAAMAVAAGAIQIAAIKKQQQASQAQGYAEGGFTPKGRKYDAVGVVHAGEWVASQALVNNPQTRPLLEALDYAQKHNTIGSLRASDVSRTINAQALLAAQGAITPAVVNNSTYSHPSPDNSERFVEVLDRLDSRLKEPFVTVNTVTGDHGILQAEEEYNRLMKNKSPKSKK